MHLTNSLLGYTGLPLLWIVAEGSSRLSATTLQ